MRNTNFPTFLAYSNVPDVFRWLGYLSWLGCVIFIGALLTTRDCQRIEHLASSFGGIVVLSMIFTHVVKIRCAQLALFDSSEKVRVSRPTLVQAALMQFVPMLELLGLKVPNKGIYGTEAAAAAGAT